MIKKLVLALNVYFLQFLSFGWAILFVSLSSAQLKDFQPFVANQPLTPSQLKAQTSFFTKIPQQLPTQRFSIDGYQIEMFSPVAALMKEIALTKGQQALPPKLFDCGDLPAKNDAIEASTPLLMDIKGQIAAICRKIEKPETIYAKKMEDPSGSMFRDIDSMLEFSLSPHQILGISFSFFPNDFNQKLRRAFVRIRYEKLKKDFDVILKNIDSALASGMGNSSQLKEIRERVNRQFGLFMESNAIAKKQVESEVKLFGKIGQFDNLPREERQALTTWLGAVYWRMRGGGLVDKPEGTQKTRLYFTAYAFQTLAELNGNQSAVGSGLMQKLIFKGWGEWMDMGNTPGEDSEMNDLINMTARGVYQVDSIVGSVKFPNVLRAAGLQMGNCYITAWKQLRDIYFLPDLKPPFDRYMDGPTAWAEYCVGAALGYGLSAGVYGL